MEGGYRRVRTRRRVTPDYGSSVKTLRSTVRLIICVVVFLSAVLMKALTPNVFASLSESLTTAVDYNSALTVLGEGVSGDRKFTTALGEAFAYAFTSVPEIEAVPEEPVPEVEPVDDAVSVFGGSQEELGTDVTDTGNAVGDGETAADTSENELVNAIISAFMQTQETFSDYALPAGVTYEMPSLGIAYTVPVAGDITSHFGYREHPDGSGVKFHYGVDIKAVEGTPVVSFADGEVVAVGESATMGKYILLNHGGVETKYAHCSEITVSSGQTVAMGEEIARTGSSGNATAPCLHFELLTGGVWVNPGYYISENETV